MTLNKSFPAVCPYVRMADSLHYTHMELRQTLAARRLLDYQLFFVRGGHGEIRLRNESIAFKGNTLCFMQPGIVHAYAFANCRVHYIHFDLFFHPYRLSVPIIPGGRTEWSAHEKSMAQPSLNDLLNFNLPMAIRIDDADAVENALKSAVDIFMRAQMMHQLRLQGITAELVGRFLDTSLPMRTPTDISTDERLDRALLFMKGNIHDTPRLSDIAEAAGLSPSRFSHVFKKRHNCSPVAYFNRLRMERAAELMRKSGAKVSVVAQDFCYDNPLNFSRDFKKIIGTSPGQYRKLML